MTTEGTPGQVLGKFEKKDRAPHLGRLSSIASVFVLVDPAVRLDEATAVNVHRTICRVVAVAVNTAATLSHIAIQVLKLIAEPWLSLSYCCFAVGHKYNTERKRKSAIQAQISTPVLHATHAGHNNAVT